MCMCVCVSVCLCLISETGFQYLDELSMDGMGYERL